MSVFSIRYGDVAFRALLVDRLVIRREVALRIIFAAIEEIAAPRLLLNDLAILAFRTEDTDGVLLDVLTLWVR